MADLTVVWTPGSVLSPLIGGLLLGYYVVARFDNPIYSPAMSAVIVLLIGVLFLFIFWVPQIVDQATGKDPVNTGRLVSRSLLSFVCVLTLALGTFVGITRDRHEP